MSKGKVRGSLVRTTALVGSLCFTLMAGQALAQAQTYKFDLPAQSLSASLREYAHVSGQQIIFTNDLVAGNKAPALHGDYSADDALHRLLAGTDLVVQRTPSGAIMVRKKNEQAALNEGPANETALETVTVTGTRVSGVEPASPVETITRQNILNSGYSDTGQVIRSLSQNFSGGINPGVVGAPGSDNQQSLFGASSFNLRGLGASSTLTLVDGHRFAADGIGGSLDVSMIPISAIERIEVVTDGASALYGSDAVAGVANFILRKDFDGAETSVRYGGASEGGADEQVYDQTVGKVWSSGNALVSYEYNRSNPLYATKRSFSKDTESPYTLLPRQNRNSIFATVNQDVSSDVSLYAEGLYTSRYAWTTLTVAGTSYPATTKVDQYGISAGGQARLWGDWMFYLDGTYSDDKDNKAASGASAPSIFQNVLKSVEGHTTGTVVNLPTGPVKVAIGAGYRYEKYQDPNGPYPSRNVEFAYAEAVIPMVSPSEARIGLERLDIDLAARMESYSDFGGTTNPKIGVLYRPVQDISLRGTWSTSFHAPSLYEKYGLTELDLFPASFWGVTTPGATLMLQSGSNTDLKPEKSRGWTIGADYTPSDLPGFKASATYYKIDYSGRITDPLTNLLQALTDPTYAPFVVSSPSASQQAAFISAAEVFRNVSGGAYDPASVIAFINDDFQNVSRQLVDGVDLSVSYAWQTDFGNLAIGGDGSWLKIDQALLPTTPSERLSGTVFNPPTYKGRLNASWTRQEWVVSAAVNYVGSEIDNTGPIATGVHSWTTVDMQIAYLPSVDTGLSSGLRIALAVQNLFDEAPPLINAASTTDPGLRYDSTNASPMGRFVSISLTKDW